MTMDGYELGFALLCGGAGLAMVLWGFSKLL